ncbi:MAG: hypothetical protein ACQKBY_13280 [Verrucomicrobiales bacterium]
MSTYSTMPPNPHLPPAPPTLKAAHTRQHRAECGPRYYLAALELSQSHWLPGKPAQALLQLNKAFLADLPDDAPILQSHPLPYAALVWLLQNRHESPGFLGNPVRHFQHLATRMSGPRAELRATRAWLCFHLAQDLLPPADFPPDQRQLQSDKILIPSRTDLLHTLRHQHTRPWEAEAVKTALNQMREQN